MSEFERKQITALAESTSLSLNDLILKRDTQSATDRKVLWSNVRNAVLLSMKIRTVGTNGMYASLAMAHAAAQAGDRLLIISSLVINETIEISKPNIEIEMCPGFALTKGGSAPSTNFKCLVLQDSANDVRLKHIKIGNETDPFSGAGDVALEIHEDVKNVLLFNMKYSVQNAQNVLDNGNESYQNSLEEIIQDAP